MKPARDPAYLKRVRNLPCCSCGRQAFHAHHSTAGRGIGQKASDHESMPLCHPCHHDFHAGSGRFANWDRMKRREWQDAHAEQTRLTLGLEQCK
jgi:hypothetical protein